MVSMGGRGGLVSQEGMSKAALSCRSIADFNFDHPHAFAFDEIVECLRSLKQGRPVQIPQVTHLQQGTTACCCCSSAEDSNTYLARGAACTWWPDLLVSSLPPAAEASRQQLVQTAPIQSLWATHS